MFFKIIFLTVLQKWWSSTTQHWALWFNSPSSHSWVGLLEGLCLSQGQPRDVPLAWGCLWQWDTPACWQKVAVHFTPAGCSCFSTHIIPANVRGTCRRLPALLTSVSLHTAHWWLCANSSHSNVCVVTSWRSDPSRLVDLWLVLGVNS